MTDDEELKKVFDRYQKLLFKAANSTASETPYSFVAEFSNKTDAATATFKQLAKRYIEKAIPTAEMSSAAHTVLHAAGAIYETANVKLTTYVQMVSKLTQSAEQFKERIQAHISEDEKSGKTTTVNDLKEYIKTELRTGQGIAVTYSSGARMPTDKYAEMLSRTTRAETQNIAMLGKALDDGNDLVECSTIFPTCPTCAALQGRIYSISGNTLGYPALYKTAFKNGYSCIHPNCRHQFFPYNPKFHTKEERTRLEENTRRPFDIDPQSEKMRIGYAKTQTQMRQWNNEMNRYDEYKRQCAERGEKPVYKTLGSFRRAYRTKEGTVSYAKTHYVLRDARQYEGYKLVLGDGLPDTLAKFQELKYNDVRRFDLLRQYKETVSEGGVTNIGFEQYEKVLKQAQRKIIGVRTTAGVTVQGISKHLVDRIIGSETQKRAGVTIDEIVDTLENGFCDGVIKTNVKGQPSIKFESDSAIVTFNPDTFTVVQCNPKSRKKKNG